MFVKLRNQKLTQFFGWLQYNFAENEWLLSGLIWSDHCSLKGAVKGEVGGAWDGYGSPVSQLPSEIR